MLRRTQKCTLRARKQNRCAANSVALLAGLYLTFRLALFGRLTSAVRPRGIQASLE